jgi:site-specific DNA recombinase
MLRLERQISGLRRGVSRLIDSYAEGVIDKGEFEPRITGLKQRISQLQERRQASLEAVEVERHLSLVVSLLEGFSAKLVQGLGSLEETGVRKIIRALAQRIEIDDPRIKVIFRVPSLDGSPGPTAPTKTNASRQHCTSVSRTILRLGHALSKTGQGLQTLRLKPGRLPHHRPRLFHAQERRYIRRKCVTPTSRFDLSVCPGTI